MNKNRVKTRRPCPFHGEIISFLYLRPRFKLMKSRTSKIHLIFDDDFNVNKMELGGADFAYVVLFRRIFYFFFVVFSVVISRLFLFSQAGPGKSLPEPFLTVE